MNKQKERFQLLTLFIILLISHAYYHAIYPRFINPNILTRFYTVISLLEDKTFKINKCIEYYGDIQDRARYGKNFYSDKPPGVAIFVLPTAWFLSRVCGIYDARIFLWAITFFGLTVPVILFWLSLVQIFHRVIRNYSLSVALVLAGAIGTNHLIYATQLFSHVLAGIFLFISFLLINYIKQSIGSVKGLTLSFLSGALCGYAFACDYIVFLCVPVLFLYSLWQLRNKIFIFLPFIMGLILIGFLLLLYNKACFGSYFTTGFNVHGDPYYRAAYARGFMGIQSPQIRAFWGLTFGVRRGLFIYAPVLGLSFLGCFRLLRYRLFAPVFLVVGNFIGLLIFSSCMVDWGGNWAVGPRYMVPGIPFLLLSVAWLLRGIKKDSLILDVFCIFTIFGILMNSLAISSFSAFPNVFVNPIFNLALPLLVEGYYAPTLFTFFSPGTAFVIFLLFMCFSSYFIVYCVKGCSLWKGFQLFLKYLLIVFVIAMLVSLKGEIEIFEAERMERWEAIKFFVGKEIKWNSHLY